VQVFPDLIDGKCGARGRSAYARRDRFRVDAVDGRHGHGQLPGELPKQHRQLPDRSDAIETREQLSPLDIVHDRPRTAQRTTRFTRQMNARRCDTRVGDGGLHCELLCAHERVGNDSHDNVFGNTLGHVAETDPRHRGPLPAVKWFDVFDFDGWPRGGERDRNGVGRNTHGIYRNGKD
jgi:hypothetical protein